MSRYGDEYGVIRSRNTTFGGLIKDLEDVAGGPISEWQAMACTREAVNRESVLTIVVIGASNENGLPAGGVIIAEEDADRVIDFLSYHEYFAPIGEDFCLHRAELANVAHKQSISFLDVLRYSDMVLEPSLIQYRQMNATS